MATTTRKTAAAAPDPKRGPIADPAALLAAALQASTPSTNSNRRTAASTAAPEALSQPLTDRDKSAMARLGWFGKLTSNKSAEPKPTAKVKTGPIVNAATYSNLSPERQASTQFWAGLCSTLARSAGRVWLPEVAAVAAQLGVPISSPSQLANRLSALTGLPVHRPTGKNAGWLICDITEPMQGAELWAQIWNGHLQQFSDAVAAESAD